MAEIVQRHCENMVKELHELRRTKLLSEDMIRSIVIARKDMEGKINSTYSKNINDFRSYIKQETAVLEKIRKSRDKKKIFEKKSYIEYSILKRIRRIYELARKKFTSDYSIHEEFFHFCKKYKFNTNASYAIETMISLFVYRPEVWRLAVSWYYHINNVDKAFQFLHKGLTFNKDSILLYNTAIELELGQVTTVDCDDPEKCVIENKCCENIKTYISLIFNNITDLEYVASVLVMLEEHSFTNTAQQLILEQLFKNHSKEAFTWHVLAKREQRGMHFVTDPNERLRSPDLKDSYLMYCIDKYLQGLQIVDKHKKIKLWSFYLETLIEIKNENETSYSRDSIELLRSALQQAHEEKCLEEKYYNVWDDLVPDDEARTILSEATNIYPESAELWKLQLKFAIKTDQVDEIDSTFKLGVSALKERSLNLWLMVLKYYLSVSEFEKIKTIFETGIKQPPKISNALKPKYIEWIAFQEGIQSARSRYSTLAEGKPFCKELHLLMSKLEQSQKIIDFDSWQNVHRLACEQFGEDDSDVWINFAKFILLMKPNNYSDKIYEIHAKSMKTLQPHLWQQFKETFDKLLTESQCENVS